MRLIAGYAFFALLTLSLATPVIAQDNCAPGPNRGGMTGQIDKRVTQKIGNDGCSDKNEEGADSTAQECQFVRLSYSPPLIHFSQQSVPQLSYEPDGCKKPSAKASFRIVKISGATFELSGLDSGVVSVLDIKSGGATIEVVAGSMRDTANVESVGYCVNMRIDMPGDKIHIRELSRVAVKFTPDNCYHKDVRILSLAPEIAWIEQAPSGLSATLYGRSVGRADIDFAEAPREGALHRVRRIDVVNDGPNCDTLILHYALRKLRLDGRTDVSKGSGVSPQLDYRPVPCRRPEGNLNFLATTSDNGFVDAKSGEVTARRLGTVTVQATHGTMHATDTIEIVRKPDCTKVTLTYEHSELGVGETGLPMHSFTGPSEDGNDPANCSQPVEAASYSSSNSDVASVVSYSGKITAHALGTAMITVKIGDGPIQGQAELKVVRE